MIQSGPPDEDRAISTIFHRNQASISRTLQSRGAHPDQVDDLLQEAMLILIQKVKANEFHGKSSIHTFFRGICRMLYMADNRKNRPFQPLDSIREQEDDFDVSLDLEKQDQQRKLHHCLKRLGEDCRKILLLRVESPPVPWEELALEFGFKNAQNAMNKGGKCMRQLRQCFFH